MNRIIAAYRDKDTIIRSLFYLFFLVVTYLAYYKFSAAMPLSGDEGYYFRAAGNFRDLFLSLVTFNFDQILSEVEQIVEKGWFVPGMSFITTPVRFFTDSVAITRAYLFLVNFSLLLYICFQIEKQFGLKQSIFFLALCTINPIISIFSFTLWGEMIAMKIVIILMFLIYKYYKNWESFHLNNRQILLFSFLFITMVYTRHSYIVVVPVVMLFIIGAFVRQHLSQAKKFREWLIIGFKLGFITLITCMLLGVWSSAVSWKYGCCFYTSTTVKLGLLDKYLNENGKQNLKEEYGTYKINSLHVDIEREAKRKGTTYAAVLDRRLEEAKVPNFRGAFIDKKDDRFHSVLLNGNLFIRRFETESRKAVSRGQIEHINLEQLDHYYDITKALSELMWYVCIFFFFCGIFWIYPLDMLWLNSAVLLKVLFVACAIHILVRLGQERHYYGLLLLSSYMGSVILSKGMRLPSIYPLKSLSYSQRLNLFLQLSIGVCMLSYIAYFLYI